jgi:S1-C subfamily serine protease
MSTRRLALKSLRSCPISSTGLNDQLKLSMSASDSRVDRLDVHRPQPSSWLIRQTHRGLLVFLLIVIYEPALAADIPALVRKAKPAVVQILCYDQDDELAATGTGFFISPDGKLLTNYHVIADAEDVVADAGAERYVLKSVLVGDKDRDVAELQFFVRPGPPVAYLTLGISADAVEGERVLVIGNPKGLEGTVSDGIISAFRKEGAIIQITAPISPGSSGSPLIDPESGKVIGMAKAIADDGQNLTSPFLPMRFVTQSPKPNHRNNHQARKFRKLSIGPSMKAIQPGPSRLPKSLFG